MDSFKEDMQKTRGRLEQRRVRVYDIQDMIWNTLSAGFWEFYIKEIIEVKRIREQYNTKTKGYKSAIEYSYYISTCKKSAKDYNKIIRNHWSIENSNHYVRDVSLNEDKSRIRKNPINMAKIRSFALNIMRNNKVTNISQELYRNALGGIENYII